MTFKDGLRRAIEARGISQEELAQQLGVSRPAVSQWLSGGTTPKGARLEQIAAALQVSVPEMFGDDDGIQATVPVVGYVGAGEQVFPFENDELGVGLEYVPNPPGGDGSMVAVIVRGDSMIPAFWVGDLLYYTPSERFDRGECLYKACVVKVKDGPIYVKHVMPGRSEASFNLMSFNANPIMEVGVQWAAPVRYHDMQRRDVKSGHHALVPRKPMSSRVRKVKRQLDLKP